MIGAVEQTSIAGSSNDGLTALSLDGVAIVGDTILAFQHHGTTLPIGLQLCHSSTLHTCNRLYGIGGVKAQPQATTVLTLSDSLTPSCMQQDEH